ncbi:hypothetical protein HDU86_002796 [Geranomyces michiganensis]|nr:hypothetical protein HDU86_002796 [Geranomyces michiganensis]
MDSPHYSLDDFEPASSSDNLSGQQTSASALYADDFDTPDFARLSALPSASSQRRTASNQNNFESPAAVQGSDELEYEDDFEVGSSRDVTAGFRGRSAPRRSDSASFATKTGSLNSGRKQSQSDERAQSGILNEDGRRKSAVDAFAVVPATVAAAAGDVGVLPPSSLFSTQPPWRQSQQQLETGERKATERGYDIGENESERRSSHASRPVSNPHVGSAAAAPAPMSVVKPLVPAPENVATGTQQQAPRRLPRDPEERTEAAPSAPATSNTSNSRARKRPGYRDRIRAAHAAVPSHSTYSRIAHPSSSSKRTAASAGEKVSYPDTPPTRPVRREQTLQEKQDLEADQQRVQAIMDLLERKRAEFREQRRVEVEERITLAAYHKLYPRTDLATHRNAIPADWTSTLWYREAVEQAHHQPYNRNKPHAHCTAITLRKGMSSDVVFGRLLTPGVRAFRAPEDGDEDNENDDFDEDEQIAFARHTPLTALPPIPIPPMPSLDLSIRLSGESEELYETAELGKKREPGTTKNHEQFTRMSENITRNKETVCKLLAHKPPLFGTNVASVATPDIDSYGVGLSGDGDGDGGMRLSIHDLAEGNGDPFYSDRAYEIHVRRETSGGGDATQVDVTTIAEPVGGNNYQQEPSQSARMTPMMVSSAGILRSGGGFTVQAAEQLTREIVSGSRRGSVAVKELLTAPVVPTKAGIAAAQATSWQRRPSSLDAKPMFEEDETTNLTASVGAEPTETVHEEHEPEEGNEGQMGRGPSPPDDDRDDDAREPISTRSAASTPKSSARSSSRSSSASSSFTSDNNDDESDNSQQGFDESDEESTSRLFDTSRARTPWSPHRTSSAASSLSRPATASTGTFALRAPSATGSASVGSRASSSHARHRSASSGHGSVGGSVMSYSRGPQQHEHGHQRRGRRRRREASGLAAAAGPATSVAKEDESRTKKPARQELAPLTLDEVIAWEGLKIMKPVVRIQRKMWTVV